MPSTYPSHRLAAAALILLAACGGGGGGTKTDATYQVTIRYDSTLGSVNADQQAAVEAAFAMARERMERTVKKGLSVVPVDSECGEYVGDPNAIPINETVHGLVILVSLKDLGDNSLLAQSGPCIARRSNSLPLVSVMRINTGSLQNMVDNETLANVVLHEMHHALGFGTLWTVKDGIGFDLVSGTSDDPRYIGSHALSAAKEFNNAPPLWTSVPLESTGGTGTASAHWRESVFANELMTGFIATGSAPLSATSIAALSDLGYSVDLTQADAFPIPNPDGALREAGAEPPLHMGDDLLHVQPVLVDD